MSTILKRTIILASLFASTFLFAQVEMDEDSVALSERYIVFEGDTLLIELDEILLLKKWNFFGAENSNLKNLDSKRKISKVSPEFRNYCSHYEIRSILI